ncbi:MAG: formylglycine-generating enzyme family protein [Bacteroidetes bacterium]|nr:formylglycine-generating enzyme family protein [Bacteroidota bacterium]
MNRIRLYIMIILTAGMLLHTACNDDDAPTHRSLEMVPVPAGDFTMGDEFGNGEVSEKPLRTVSLTAFMISKHEITQEIYQEVVGQNPSRHVASDHPVESVTWFDALEFCNLLSEKHGYRKCYADIDGNPTVDPSADGYRLPTEAEWEYACKAGTSSAYYTGNSKADLGRAGWYSGNADGTTHRVGLLEPNAFGLFDMHGNVFEWCWDWHSHDYYGRGENVDPFGPDSGTERVCRGGSYFVFEYGHRSSFRSMLKPRIPSRDIGLRVVRRPS